MKKILLLILTLCAFSSMVYSDITWSTPATISTAATNASSPAVVLDANNNATAAWVENGIIKASSLPSGGSWSAPVSISNALNTSSNPLLGIDSSGNVIALWIENTEIASATLPFGGSWSAETFPISGSGASNPALAVDASGNAVAVWVRSGFIESSTMKSGSWSLVSVLSAANSSNPDLAISSFGTAIAAWHTVNVSGSDVIVTDILTILTNTWAASKNVFSGTAAFKHNYPSIAIDANGNAAVAWFRYGLLDGNAYQNVEVLVSSLSQGGSAWSIATILSNPGIRNPADLTIKVLYDTSGDAVIVWTNSYDGLNFSVESSMQLFGGSWQTFIDPQAPTLYSFGIDFSVSGGTVILASMAWDGVSNIVVQAQESDSTNPLFQAWTQAVQVSTGNYNAYPECAVSIAGSTLQAVAVWLYFDGSNTRIQASTGSGSVVAPPSNVSATQNETDYGVYQDFYNTITWNASSEPHVIQYNIYRNGVFFAATDPSTLTFVDHNTTNGGAVTYGVAALTNRFRQSVIVSFTLN